MSGAEVTHPEGANGFSTNSHQTNGRNGHQEPTKSPTGDSGDTGGVTPAKGEVTTGPTVTANGSQWFSECSDSGFPGQSFSLKVDRVLVEEESAYQKLLLFQSTHHGKVMVLDGMIQFSEYDEFAYQEMMTFLPLNSHPCPKKVLIIGGGDGGVAREVSKHPAVERVVMCEIDQKVVDVCREHVPSMAAGFDSPKLDLRICDGFEFLRENEEKFDVIITDSSDPQGPATALFEKPFYSRLKDTLTEDGILCSQGQCVWLEEDRKVIKEVLRFCRDLFPVVSYATAQVPTYTTGQIGMFLCSKNTNTEFSKPVRVFSEEESESMHLRYYNEDMHRGSFLLPRFAKEATATCE